MQSLSNLPEIGTKVRIRVEVAKGGLAKRDASGRIEFATPFPCPYNYGSIVDTVSSDGEGIDVILLGPRVARGETREATVRAVAAFVDAGKADPKVVCSQSPLSAADRRLLTLFFRIYAPIKRAKQLLDGEPGDTRFDGWR